MRPPFPRLLFLAICGIVFAIASIPVFASAAPGPVHGLWVWKTSSVLEPAGSAEALRDFCRANGINEVYVSVSGKGGASDDARLTNLIELLHRSDLRVEALLGSTDADEP